MRDAEKTIVNLIDKQGVSFIASTDSDGFPNMKPCSRRANGKLDFGTWKQIFYGVFDGMRDKRVLVKIIGE